MLIIDSAIMEALNKHPFALPDSQIADHYRILIGIRFKTAALGEVI